MKITSSHIDKRKKADVFVLPFWQGAEKAELAINEKFDTKALPPLALGDFKGKEGEIALVYHEEQRVVLLGLGKKENASTEYFRRAFGTLGKYCIAKKLKSLNLSLPVHTSLGEGDILRGTLEGFLHVNYHFDKYKSEPGFLIEEINLIGSNAAMLKYAQKLLHIFDGVNLAKTLSNTNADQVTPRFLGELAVEIGKKYSSVKTTVLTKKQIEKEGMSLLLAVNRGSARDPAFIVMRYTGDQSSKDHTVIVGKGITFDTGGLNIKPTGSMETMKCDMSGAAAGFGLIVAAANIGLKANFTLVVPSTENMIGSRSYIPGDVIKTAIGKTVEVDNTDAEGRLVLADGFMYANKHLAPTRMIDIATLTGGMVVALGEELTGMMGNHEPLLKALEKAGEATFERVWRMPSYPEYRDQLKSDIADIKNTGGRQGGTICAAVFLKEFVGDTPWAHLDIAGTAYLSRERRYLPKNATGVGVRLLIEFLESFKPATKSKK